MKLHYRCILQVSHILHILLVLSEYNKYITITLNRLIISFNKTIIIWILLWLLLSLVCSSVVWSLLCKHKTQRLCEWERNTAQCSKACENTSVCLCEALKERNTPPIISSFININVKTNLQAVIPSTHRHTAEHREIEQRTEPITIENWPYVLCV